MSSDLLDDIPKIPPIVLGDGFDLDIDYYLRREYEDVGEAATVLPAIIEHTNCKLQSMAEMKIVQKQKVAATRARAYFELKDGRFEQLYNGKVTDTAINMAVELDEAVVKETEVFARVVGWAQRLANSLVTLQAKLDLTRSTEATRRTMASGDPERDD
jgi:hypothetical protein